MRIRGERRCADCGRAWSYYQRGSIECPDCGSIHSVAAETDRRRHTDGPAGLDVTDARAAIDEEPLDVVAELAEQAARTYLATRGFISAGGLLPLDDTYLAAAELRAAAGHVRRALRLDDAEREYFYGLLAGADEGERPPVDTVPTAMQTARGLAAADGVSAYHAELTTWLDDHPDPGAAPAHERLGQHARRVAALDGAISPREADGLVAAAKELGTYLREDDEGALARAQDQLDRLG